MLGLLLFMLFVGMVAAAAVGIVEEASQASPRDPPPSAAARFGASHPDEAVHVSGALGVLLIGGSGLVGLILRPERPGYSYQVLAAMLGALLTLPVVGNPDNYGGQAGWIDPVLLVFILPPMLAAAVAFPWRRWGSRHGWRPSLLLLAVIAAVPAAWYGVEQALIQRNTFPPTADPHHNAHWWVMGMLAFMIVLVVGAAAVPTTGWRLGAAVGGFAAMVVGGSFSRRALGGVGSAAWICCRSHPLGGGGDRVHVSRCRPIWRRHGEGKAAPFSRYRNLSGSCSPASAADNAPCA
jgi:hypothetical protein